MDDGLKFWRSILPDQVTGEGEPGEVTMRTRIDRFTGQLVDAGHSVERARSIAIDCAKKEDRRK
tara:strand:- start:1335 stop:1526 length:192 start_codon:yes stop_codon:yes gene_type:complete